MFLDNTKEIVLGGRSILLYQTLSDMQQVSFIENLGLIIGVIYYLFTSRTKK